METRVKRNALFNKGAHPRPSLCDKSSVHLKISKTIGKTKETKRTKEVKGKQHTQNIENTKHNKYKQNVQIYVAQTGHRSKSVFCLFVFGIIGVFLQVVPLIALVILFSFWFYLWLLMFSNFMFKHVPGNN